jgi:hypothetical protein
MKLEALEPRLLLSGDGLLPDGGDGQSYTMAAPAATEKTYLQKTDLYHSVEFDLIDAKPIKSLGGVNKATYSFTGGSVDPTFNRRTVFADGSSIVAPTGGNFTTTAKFIYLPPTSLPGATQPSVNILVTPRMPPRRLLPSR